MKEISCGFILEEPNGILLCHPTGKADRWDFPKGRAEIGESHLEAAIRELVEETSILLNRKFVYENVIDIGCHPYTKEKDLHLFYLRISKIDVLSLLCTSVFEYKGRSIREMDGYKLVKRQDLIGNMGKSMQAWLQAHFKE